MKETIICLGCWENLNRRYFIRGPLSVFFKPFGITKSKLHPNLCTICETNFEKYAKQKQLTVDTTILFADLRGYTSLSQQLDADKVTELLQCFYEKCSASIWETDGIVNKFIGDAVLAIYNFPLARPDHVQRAVQSAVLLQQACKDLKAEAGIPEEYDVGVGIGITTGPCSVGEFGTSFKEFTAIGPVVNLASRLQNAASAGEIAVTEDVYAKVKDEFPNYLSQELSLKGIEGPVNAYILKPLEAQSGARMPA